MNFFDAMKNWISNIDKFRHLFIISAFVGGFYLLFFSWQLKISLWYVLVYSFFIFMTFLLIVHISRVNDKSKEEFEKKEFFKFVIIYILFIFVYILIFWLLFFLTTNINKGYLILPDGITPIESWKDFLFFSGVTFLSYDVGIFPIGSMKILVFIELFVSQVVILGFLFVVFGILMEKIRGKV